MGKWSTKSWKELLKVKGPPREATRTSRTSSSPSKRASSTCSRPAPASAVAAVRIAVEMVKERLTPTGVLRVGSALGQLLHPVRPHADRKVLTKGLPASPARPSESSPSPPTRPTRHQNGEKVLLIRKETSPEDVQGMQRRRHSHQHRRHDLPRRRRRTRLGQDLYRRLHLQIDDKNRRLNINGQSFGPDDYLSIDGTTGEVIEGQMPTVDPQMTGPFGIVEVADKYRTLGARTNADTPRLRDRAEACCRRHRPHPHRAHVLRPPHPQHAEMILATDEEGRRRPRQAPPLREDFIGIFQAMKGLPVTIRLLDPPLHEFLPHEEKEQYELANSPASASSRSASE